MSSFPQVDFGAAAARLDGVIQRTPLARFSVEDSRLDLRLKLENLQVCGAFKARGAWNQVVQLDPAARRAGVAASSSGNHGAALAWAAQRAGVPCTICMPGNAYANKIQACRDWDAKVVLSDNREAAELACAELVAQGARLIHPFDSWKTIEGAGTVGLEIAEDWPEVELVVVPVGGGGLIAGVSLALQRVLGSSVSTFGVEPEGATNLAQGLAAGKPVALDSVATSVQGLCPLAAGVRNLAVVEACVRQVDRLTDDSIFSAQRVLVQQSGWTVEPAGAASCAWVFQGAIPSALLEGRDSKNPLRVVALVSGGNPDPEQLAAIAAIS